MLLDHKPSFPSCTALYEGVRAFGAPVGLRGPDKPQLRLPPHSLCLEAYLSSSLFLTATVGLCIPGVSSAPARSAQGLCYHSQAGFCALLGFGVCQW